MRYDGGGSMSKSFLTSNSKIYPNKTQENIFLKT